MDYHIRQKIFKNAQVPQLVDGNGSNPFICGFESHLGYKNFVRKIKFGTVFDIKKKFIEIK